MPIKTIQLKRFKCFLDSEEIPIAPLTVIFGRNNAGKSSILQSLLLLKQTLDAPEVGARLNLRGNLYGAGSYHDVVHQHRVKNHVSFILGIESRAVYGKVELEFASGEPNPPRLTKVRITSTGIEPLEIHTSSGSGGPYKMKIGTVDLGRERAADFVFPVNSFLPRIGFNPILKGRPNKRHERSRIVARTLLFELDSSLRHLRALSAFRHEPRRNYEYVGRSTAYEARGGSIVNALIEDSTRGRHRGKLLASVNQWLKQVGRVRLLPIRRISSSVKLFELRIKDTDSGRWANFADVGFGIGQALPVFVEGLETPFGETFVVQEPEIHLHPDAQIGMADFLISLVQSGRRVIVETHSENILLRLRHAILNSSQETGSNTLAVSPADVSIIHVNKNLDGTSNAQHLGVDSFGQIEHWPKGFMEEATEERMALMKSMAKAVKTAA